MKSILALSFCLLLGSVTESLACSCAPPPPPKQAAEKAAAVFSGKVLEVNKIGDFQLEVKFEILQTWKGTKTKTVKVNTGSNGAICGYHFEVGEKYLVYCYAQEEKLGTNICTRTTSLKQAEADLKDLGEGSAPKEEAEEKPAEETPAKPE